MKRKMFSGMTTIAVSLMFAVLMLPSCSRGPRIVSNWKTESCIGEAAPKIDGKRKEPAECRIWEEIRIFDDGNFDYIERFEFVNNTYDPAYNTIAKGRFASDGTVAFDGPESWKNASGVYSINGNKRVDDLEFDLKREEETKLPGYKSSTYVGTFSKGDGGGIKSFWTSFMGFIVLYDDGTYALLWSVDPARSLYGMKSSIGRYKGAVDSKGKGSLMGFDGSEFGTYSISKNGGAYTMHLTIPYMGIDSVLEMDRW